MKTIGLLGGMSWESTVTYYKIINEIIKNKLGGFHSAKILLYSVDFHEIEECQARGDWDKSAEILSAGAQSLEKGGADFLVICTNTMHKVADKIKGNVKMPLLHIADATAEELRAAKIEKVALLGTKYTMTQDFYKSNIEAYGISVLTPNESDIETMNDIIYKELCLGTISKSSKEKVLNIINHLANNGAQGVILGCTEIGMLIKKQDLDLPVFDTAEIHAKKAAILALL